MATSHLAATLRHITDRKLDKLAGQQETFEKNKANILKAAEHEADAAEKLRVYLQGHKDNNIPMQLADKDISNIEKGLKLAEYDASVSESLLLHWCSVLEKNLAACSAKYKYADLFGRMVTEWIDKPDEQFKERLSDGDYAVIGQDSGGLASTDTSATMNTVRGDLTEQRQLLDNLWFGDDGVDSAKVRQYLDKLFENAQKAKKGTASPLKVMRDWIASLDFEVLVTVDSVKCAIKRLLALNLFIGEKRQALLSLESHEEVLQEMVDVLQMDLNSIKTWNWPGPIPVEFRRQVNLKARAFTDEEIHVALLISIFGSHLSAHLRGAFHTLYHSDAWSREDQTIPKVALMRRKYWLGAKNASSTDSYYNLHADRRRLFQEKFLLTQLPDGDADVTYNEEADPEGFLGSQEEGSSHTIRQELLRVLTTEMKLYTKLHGEFTVFQTDIRLFHPSISHTAILTILEFFGLHKEWLAFIRNFLRPSLFWAQDGPNAQLQTRQRGTSIGHLLSTVLGETMMFCLDYAVNQRTRGHYLYRLHDDICFWGKEETCVEAWKAVEEFVEVVGLTLNMSKTGSAKVLSNDKDGSTRQATKDPSLPEGKVSWGLLLLDAEKGVWTIDRALLDMHIAEFRRQLAVSRSTMSWVQRWNSYAARFLAPNFGKPAKCLGVDHVRRVLDALKYMQSEIFQESDSSKRGLSSYLRQRIAADFDVHDIPDGFFFWPHELGGLELMNPFISFQNNLLYAGDDGDSSDPFEIVIKNDREEWETRRDTWNEGKRYTTSARDLSQDVIDEMKGRLKDFMSLEEYTEYREQISNNLVPVYRRLLSEAEPVEIGRPVDLDAARYAVSSNIKMIVEWEATSVYWKWIFSLFGAEIADRFGSVAMGDKELLPFGLLHMLQNERVRWQD